jgi:DNA polymerase III sliding clamp (beta) subunit (PCNA family)
MNAPALAPGPAPARTIHVTAAQLLRAVKAVAAVAGTDKSRTSLHDIAVKIDLGNEDGSGASLAFTATDGYRMADATVRDNQGYSHPNYDAVRPQALPYSVTVNRTALLGILKSTKEKHVNFEPCAEGRLKATCGETTFTIAAAFEGEGEWPARFTTAYLRDMLTTIEGDEVAILGSGKLHAFRVCGTSPQAVTVVYLLMPVRE